MSAGRQVAGLLAGAWRANPPSLGEAVDVADLTPLLLHSGAAGLAWGQVRDTAQAQGAAALHDAYRMQRIYARLSEQRLADALAALERAGVEAVLAKGLAAARAYREPGLRAVGDNDLYVRAENHPAARSALHGHEVDLHCGFAALDDQDEARVWERTRLVEIAGARVRVFGDEHHLRLVAIHLIAHGAWRPLWLCDVAALVEARTDAFDWAEFFSGDARRTEAATVALSLARVLLGADLAGTPIANRAPPGWTVATVLTEWGRIHHYRAPVVTHALSPRTWWEAARGRWPNPIEASIYLGAPLSSSPLLVRQFAAFVGRATDGVARLVRRR
jgi:hypothetical protein